MKTECNVFSPSNYELSCNKHSCTSLLKYRLNLSSGWTPTRELLYYGQSHFSLFSDTVKYLITKLHEFLFSNILANIRYYRSLILTHDCLVMCLAVILIFPCAVCVFTSFPICQFDTIHSFTKIFFLKKIMNHTHAVTAETRRGCQTHWAWNHRWL